MVRSGAYDGWLAQLVTGRTIGIFHAYSRKPGNPQDTDHDRKLEQIADLKGFESTGWWGIWLGLDPDDSPLMLREAGTQDVYALDWEAP